MLGSVLSILCGFYSFTPHKSPKNKNYDYQHFTEEEIEFIKVK